MFSRYLAFHKNQSTVGFSLIELLVSIGIIILVLTIVITQQGPFNSAVLLRSQAYEVALTLREVQQSAVSAINDASSGTEDFRSTLGIHFDLGTPDRHVFFKDDNDNDYYDGADEQFGPASLLDSRFEFSAMDSESGTISGGSVSISFERPNFDARFYDGPNSLLDTPSITVTIRPVGSAATACPEVRQIEITRTGQIAVLEC